MDTQGAELQMLSGATALLNEVGFVEIEVEVLEICEGQPLFTDVLQAMSARGFDLLYLNRVFAQRRQIFSGRARGQLIFGDALFGWLEDQLSSRGVERRMKYVLALCNYGHIDFACHICQESERLKQAIPAMEHSIVVLDMGVGQNGLRSANSTSWHGCICILAGITNLILTQIGAGHSDRFSHLRNADFGLEWFVARRHYVTGMPFVAEASASHRSGTPDRSCARRSSP